MNALKMLFFAFGLTMHMSLAWASHPYVRLREDLVTAGALIPRQAKTRSKATDTVCPDGYGCCPKGMAYLLRLSSHGFRS